MEKQGIDIALELAGDNHRFQKTLVGLICISWMLTNFILMGSSLIYMDPLFNCGGDNIRQYSESEACQRTDCQIKLGLYCDLEWARDTIQSTLWFGSFVGLFIMNLIADTKGRRISTLISVGFSLVSVILTILGAVVNNVPVLIMAQLLGGFGAYALCTLSYTLLYDFCSEASLPKSIVIVEGSWSVSTIALGVVFLLEINWLTFLLYVILLPLTIISVCLSKFIKQSPYILMGQGKKFEALEVLTKMAIMNGRDDKIEQIRKIILCEQNFTELPEPSFKGVFKVLKQWVYLKPIIILTVIYGIGNVYHFGTSYCLDEYGAGYGYNNIIDGLVELFSFSFLNYFINKIPRKKGISGFNFLVMASGMLFLIPIVTQSKVLGTIALSISNVFAIVSYTMVACMQVEAFTVEIQSTAVGFIEAFSLYGGLLGPLVVDLSDKIGVNPIVLISLIMNFAVWPTIFLKETLVVNEIRNDQEKAVESSQDLRDSLISESENEKERERKREKERERIEE